MKKIILAIFMVGLVSGQVFAQGKKAEFSLNLGIMTNVEQDHSFDYAALILDGRLGLPIGKSFELSPEVMINPLDIFVSNDVFWLLPGLMLNYKAGHFFFGAGIVLPIVFEAGGSAAENLVPKINIGYRSRKLMFTVCVVISTEMDLTMGLGATIGYRF